jgi:hypothetical protein
MEGPSLQVPLTLCDNLGSRSGFEVITDRYDRECKDPFRAIRRDHGQESQAKFKTEKLPPGMCNLRWLIAARSSPGSRRCRRAILIPELSACSAVSQVQRAQFYRTGPHGGSVYTKYQREIGRDKAKLSQDSPGERTDERRREADAKHG